MSRVAVWDDKTNQMVELLTNNFEWSCNTIGELYKSCWQTEFF